MKRNADSKMLKEDYESKAQVLTKEVRHLQAEKDSQVFTTSFSQSNFFAGYGKLNRRKLNTKLKTENSTHLINFS